ncbi:hypothetical protein QG041_00605 [Kingella kingae]|nr:MULTISPECIES: hypothetical protein [Kingella]MDK4534888.1 hypothetical protein [Kingella kingae]MDK4541363.1 hypothetical protein [Kingella kingae]MDK4553938.1 hypothetical protein [Kingella kingae]MDK4567896.1 hypothetical protein [Kingella kingae]MDK4569791.1 hypothetical protein [Kingella kingae]
MNILLGFNPAYILSCTCRLPEILIPFEEWCAWHTLRNAFRQPETYQAA